MKRLLKVVLDFLSQRISRNGPPAGLAGMV